MTRFLTIDDAAALIEDGMLLGFGGMTIYRRPVAFVMAMLRRSIRPRDLTLFGFTHGYEADLLVGAGCAAAVRSCYFGLESFGFAPMFTERVNRGEVRVIEETEASIGCGLRAATAGIGFMPSTAWIGTDLPKLRPDVLTVTDPYTGETLTAFPAIHPDIAVLHALEADRFGNVALNQNVAIDLELAAAAKTVIVTYEQQVERLEKAPDRIILPGVVVDVAALAPRGAWPTSCYPRYTLDGEALMAYVDACNAGEFDVYVEQLIQRAQHVTGGSTGR
ncbi:MAG: CoA-transferase [Phototrophicaceae bacterium]|nr:3-oxoadipate CoA-transferase subunit A [Anaerolineae bacterium]